MFFGSTLDSSYAPRYGKKCDDGFQGPNTQGLVAAGVPADFRVLHSGAPLGMTVPSVPLGHYVRERSFPREDNIIGKLQGAQISKSSDYRVGTTWE